MNGCQELCWQVFTSLTFGARGVLYFTYWDDPDGVHYGYGNAVITRRALPGTFNASDANQGGLLTRTREDYVKGPHWYDAKRINSVVLAYGTLLLHARSTAIFHCDDCNNLTMAASPYVGDNSTKLMLTSVVGAGDVTGRKGHFLLGFFSLADGRRAVLVHNQDPAATQWATVEFSTELNAAGREAVGVMEVDPVHGTEAPLLDDSPLTQGVQLGLQPGMARFLVAPAH